MLHQGDEACSTSPFRLIVRASLRLLLRSYIIPRSRQRTCLYALGCGSVSVVTEKRRIGCGAVGTEPILTRSNGDGEPASASKLRQAESEPSGGKFESFEKNLRSL